MQAKQEEVKKSRPGKGEGSKNKANNKQPEFYGKVMTKKEFNARIDKKGKALTKKALARQSSSSSNLVPCTPKDLSIVCGRGMKVNVRSRQRRQSR